MLTILRRGLMTLTAGQSSIRNVTVQVKSDYLRFINKNLDFNSAFFFVN